MKKGFWNGKGRFLAAFFSLSCAVGMTLLLAVMMHSSMIINVTCSWFWQDIFSETNSFEETQPFYDMLYTDAGILAEYLAVSSQLETDGKYDENKIINIFDYNSRKNLASKQQSNYEEITTEANAEANAEANSEIAPEFQDVSNTESNIEPNSVENSDTDNQMLIEQAESKKDSLEEIEIHKKEKTDGSKIRADQLQYKIGDLIEWQSSGMTFMQTENTASDTIIYENDESLQDYGDGTLTEAFTPVNASSLYDVELPEGMTYQELTQMVVDAANDLNTNYRTYMQYRDYFQKNSNLKYMIVSEDHKMIYSNIDQNGKSVDDLVKAFQNNKTHLIYDFNQNNIECSNIGPTEETSYKLIFHNYAYNFPNGGVLYITPQMKDSTIFGKVNKKDFFADAEKNYNQLKSNFTLYLAGVVILALVTLLSLILFIILQPKKKKEELKYFDRWFTEIAAALGFGSTYLIASVGLFVTDDFTNGNNGYQYLMKNSICGSVAITFILLYLMLLFFLGSLVRRIKAGAIWKGSLLYYLIHHTRLILAGAGKLFGRVLNHRSLLIRTFAPYLLFLMINAFAIVAAREFGVLFDLILDGIIGILLYKNNLSREEIVKGISRICDGELDYQIPTERLYGENKVIAEAVNQIGNAVQNAVQISMKDERLKADLITNVSHDIKTPLTSIINYVDLLKREDIQSEKAIEYIQILDEKSQRLKQLTLDLVEASKISSGNITIEYSNLDVDELVKQTIGEYEDKFMSKELQVITGYPGGEGNYLIKADSRHMWRIMENLFVNIYKYAMEKTRVYVDIQECDNRVEVIVKNISAQPLNIPADELTQRFIRGDVSRSTEGSGLGLSIAKNLTEAQNGKFQIYLDGDLFKVSISFPAIEVIEPKEE